MDKHEDNGANAAETVVGPSVKIQDGAQFSGKCNMGAALTEKQANKKVGDPEPES